MYRKELWQKFLDRLLLPAGTSTISSASSGALTSRPFDASEIEQLAAWQLNGREIKNAVKTARNWCVCKGSQISVERLESAIAVTAPMAKRVEEAKHS